MTTVAYRAGVMAADSRITEDSEAGGTRLGKCEKLYRKADAIIGLAGESEPGLVFLDWYGSGKEAPEILVHGEADFSALVLTDKGLFSYGRWCRGEKVLNKFWAIGSGAKAALAAMECGAGAVEAVRIACKVDPYSAPPIRAMSLPVNRPKRPTRAAGSSGTPKAAAADQAASGAGTGPAAPPAQPAKS